MDGRGAFLSYPATFDEFLIAFFDLFAQKTFRRTDYLTYLKQLHSGDEASVIDTAIVGPLLGLLGFEPAERVYNQQRQSERPDFAPTAPVYGTCFVVEDKSTSLSLTFDLADPDSHLSQLKGYVRSTGLRFGWLTNGRQFTVWNFDNPDNPTCIIDLDIPIAILDWQNHNPPTFSTPLAKSFHDLFDLFRKESFTDPQRLEQEISVGFEEWHTQALPLGTGSGNESVLVETLQSVVMDLQRDARRTLDKHLVRYAEYNDKANRLADDALEPAAQQLRALREKVISILVSSWSSYHKMWGLETEDIRTIETILIKLEQDARAFFSQKEMLASILDVINAARRRKYAARPKSAHPMSDLSDESLLDKTLQTYCEKTFGWHQRQATLRQDYQADRSVYDDYTIWTSLVKETMLGGLNEDQQRDEFALQAAYVVFIRLLLIRVCEDKGIFPHRFLSDGGLKHWQEDIKRYLVFANGNPYSPLLNMAYDNAQNIYAHFFTGRELFNWYHVDRERLVMALHRLNRFNFTGVDSDIIGTVYNTYVNRKEKREKGQYYTPPAIVNYILDTVGYSGNAVIGSNRRLIDPACGSGSFLVTAAKRLVAAYQGQLNDPSTVLERVQQNLFGFDLNPFACYLAEVNLLIQVLDLVKLAHDAGKRPKSQRFYIYNVDALARPTGMYYYMNFNTLLAEESDQVEQIKSRAPGTPYANGFAYVVANPPYGATLSDSYKEMLRSGWADVFYGQPDTYTFFLKFGLELLANNGKLGFITPNTYLMGKNTAALRSKLLTIGCIEQIVDLPQGIWPDANVDCVLLFVAAESDEEKRKVQQVQINLLGLRDTLNKLTERAWAETMIQQQSRWMADPRHEITIRHDTLLQQIEDACRVPVNDSAATKIVRLGDIAESTQGIIPYFSKSQGIANLYIRPHREVPPNAPDWKPLLDGRAFIGRYELRWAREQPYIKYGAWLYRPHEAKYFESPKLLVQDMRNRALKRRLVATFDDQRFYNRHNFSDIIVGDSNYNLRYILALFNSSLLNYWFARRFDNVHINPSYFRQLPIYPADAATQTAIVVLVDEILTKHSKLNNLRAQGYAIRHRHDGNISIDVPYDSLLSDLQRNLSLSTLTFFDARAIGLFSIPDRCDIQASISSNIYIPDRYPTSLVLRHNKLWLEVPDDDVRRYLLGYLRRPQWRGKTWDDLKNSALIPESADARTAIFAAEERQIHYVKALLDDIKRIDEHIDEQVLDLYSITNTVDRQRILGSAPAEEEDEKINDGDEVDAQELL